MFIKRLLRRAAVTLLLILMLMLIISAWVFSASGAKFIINQVNQNLDELTIVHNEGGLGGELRLLSVVFQSEQADVTVSDMLINIDWQCAFSMDVCIEKINIDDVDVLLKPTKDSVAPSQPATSKITLPMLLEIRQFKIGTTTVSELIPDLNSTGKISQMLAIDSLSLSLDFFEVMTISNAQVRLIDVSTRKLPASNSSSPNASSPNASSPNASSPNASSPNASSPNASAPISEPITSPEQIKIQLQTQLERLSNQFTGIKLPNVFIPLDVQLNNVLLTHVCIDQSLYCAQAISIDASILDEQILTKLSVASLSSTALPDDFANLDNINLQSELVLDDQWPFVLEASLELADLGRFTLTTKGDIEHINAHVDWLKPAQYSSLNVNQKEQRRLVSLTSNVDISATHLPLTLDLDIVAIPSQFFQYWQANSRASLRIVGDISDYKVDVTTQNIAIETFLLNQFEANIGVLNEGLSLSNLSTKGAYNNWPFEVSGGFTLKSDGYFHADGFTARYLQNNVVLNGESHLFDDTDFAPMMAAVSINKLSEIVPDARGEISIKAEVASPLLKPSLVLEANINNFQYQQTSLSSASISGNIDIANKFKSRLKVAASQLQLDTFNVPQVDLIISGDDSSQKLVLSIPQGDIQTRQEIAGSFVFTDDPTDTSQQPIAWQGQLLESQLRYAKIDMSLSDVTDILFSFDTKITEISDTCWLSSATSGGVNTVQLCVIDTALSPTQAQLNVEFGADIVQSVIMLDNKPIIAKVNDYFDFTASHIVVNGKAGLAWNERNGMTLNSSVDGSDIMLLAEKQELNFEKLQIQTEIGKKGLQNTINIASKQFGNVSYEGMIFQNTSSDSTGASSVDAAKTSTKTPGRLHTASIAINDVDLSRLGAFVPQFSRMAGDVKGDLQISGALEKPNIEGMLSINNAEFLSAQYPIRLSDWDQAIIFKGQSASVDSTFRLGSFDKGGLGQLNAQIDFAQGIEIDGKLRGEDLQFAYQKHELSVSPDLAFSASPSRVNLDGIVVIPQAKIVIDSLPTSAVSPTRDIVIVDSEAPLESAIAINAKLNILIDPQQQKRVNLNALDLKTSLQGDLALSIDNQDLALSGKLNLVDGEYKAYGQVLSIRRGEIGFTGQPDLPNLDIQAIRNPKNTADDVIAGINITGNSDKPLVSLFSDPAMDQAKQLSYLLTGQDFDNPAQKTDSNTQLVNALVSFGVGRSESGIGRLGQKLGVENLNIQAAGQGDSTQVQLTGRLSDRIEISYGLGVFDSLSEVTLKYQLLPQVYLEAVSGLNNALDIYYEIERR